MNLPTVAGIPTKPSIGVPATPAEALAQLGLPRESLPRHVAVIMDGNGRWAKRQGFPRAFGHEQGTKTVKTIIRHAAKLGIEVLTLYSFSTENWKRPAEEVEFLMELYARCLLEERDDLNANTVQLLQIGRREGMPQRVLAVVDETVKMLAKNTGLKVVLAINYSSRNEIIDAVKRIAEEVKQGTLETKNITEEIINQRLYTAGLPDPDLLIRTAGEMRVSNYLLWQISYAELYVADVCWPDFDSDQLNLALRAFAKRQRRFGAVVE